MAPLKAPKSLFLRGIKFSVPHSGDSARDVVLENMVLYLIQKTQRKQQNMDLFHSRLITCTVLISEFKNKIAYLGAVKFKIKDYKYLGTLLIFTPIPLYAQEVWSLNQFPRENN